VLKAPAQHYAECEGIGCVYTRKSGSHRFVEIELAFPAGRRLDAPPPAQTAVTLH